MNAGNRDIGWSDDLREKHLRRIKKDAARVNDNVGLDGKIHPITAVAPSPQLLLFSSLAVNY
jgi:hypothetical protein